MIDWIALCEVLGERTIKKTREVIDLAGQFAYRPLMTNVNASAQRPLIKRAITIESRRVPAYEHIEGVLERRAFQTDRLRFRSSSSTDKVLVYMPALVYMSVLAYMSVSVYIPVLVYMSVLE